MAAIARLLQPLDSRTLVLLLVLAMCLILITALLLRQSPAPPAASRSVSLDLLGDLAVRVDALERGACIDEVTKLPNGRQLEQQALPQAVHNAVALQQPLTVASLRLAGLPQIRAQQGPQAADAILRTAARVTEQVLCIRRCTDRVFRRRRDEGFVIVLPGADADRARAILGNVLAHLRSAQHSAWIGAVVLQEGARAPLQLLAQADQVLGEVQVGPPNLRVEVLQ